MPVFEFQHEESGEIISVLVAISEPDEARHKQIVDGKTYKRLYSAPIAAKDTLVKDATNQDFKRVTQGKNLTVGQMWEISKEMSEQRQDKNGGIDPVKEQFYKDYEKKTGGKHIDIKKREAIEKAKKKMEEMGIKVS